MILSIVIPAYNEEAVIRETHKVIANKLNKLIESKIISEKSFLCFVDDGSKDGTWNILKEFANNGDVTPPPPFYNHQSH